MEQLLIPGTDSAAPPRAKASPIIKYAGGKRWAVPLFAPGIYRRLAKTGGRYVEPFLGGGALALDLGLPGMIVADLCGPLIGMYRAVASQPAAVAWALSALAAKGTTEEAYYRIRDQRPTSPIVAAARFIYLNKLGYNGLYRENSRGDFNVPYGKQSYRESSVTRKGRDAVESLFPSKGRLEAVSRAFKASDVLCQDFGATLAPVEAGDVVYADPPYAGTFEAYTKDGFSADDQARLAGDLQACRDRGAFVLATNADTPEIRELYAWATVMPTAELRAVNSDAKGRGRVGCVVVASDPEMLGS